MTDTPETDNQPLWHGEPAVHIDFARRLERERDEARIMTSQANNMAGYYYRLMRTYKDWALHNKRPDNTLPTAN